jgi:hypothetical protein
MSKPCEACHGQGVVYFALNPWFPTAPSYSVPCKACGGTRTAEPLPDSSSGTVTVTGIGQGDPARTASALKSALETSSGGCRPPQVTAYLSAIGKSGGEQSGFVRRYERAMADHNLLDDAGMARVEKRRELASKAARKRWGKE